MPFKNRTYVCKDCEKEVQTRNRPGTDVCRSCNSYRSIKNISGKDIRGNIKRPFEYAYNSLTRCALKMGRPVLITYSEYLEFTSIEQCHYCTAKINWTPHTNKINKHCNYFLDRMDNSRGYEKTIWSCVVPNVIGLSLASFRMVNLLNFLNLSKKCEKLHERFLVPLTIRDYE
jgi:hypothetical protein